MAKGKCTVGKNKGVKGLKWVRVRMAKSICEKGKGNKE